MADKSATKRDYMNHSMPVLVATDINSDVGSVVVDGGFGWWCESNTVDTYNRILMRYVIILRQLKKREN